MRSTASLSDGRSLEKTFSAAGRSHLRALLAPLGSLEAELAKLGLWGQGLARTLACGGRLLAAGNGGSAAHAQHLTAELVGRFQEERQPLSALALHTDSSTYTAIANDYGLDEVVARQVKGHGRPGDVFLGISTSGASLNIVRAAEVARETGLETWALTGSAPNPLADRVHQALCVDAPSTATVQEVHQVVIHLLCTALDQALAATRPELAGARQ